MTDPLAIPVSATPQGWRWVALDAVRGGALLAMAAYHATWDLGYLRLTPENYALTPLGKVAAHLIAGTFLFLVGVGLVLMNRDGIRWRAFLIRLLRIGGAAVAITVATAVAFPDSYIFFGILHCIALSSVLALPFLFLPVGLVAVTSVLVLAAPHVIAADLLDASVLAFLGLGRGVPQTNDYVPLFPWFGMVLAGMAVARFSARATAGAFPAGRRASGRGLRVLAFAGRHSLAVYLVHQPALLALLTGLATLTGPHPKAGEADFRQTYRRNCMGTGGQAEPCRIAARCVVGALRREGLWVEAGRSFTTAERQRAQALSQDCYEAADAPRP
ncbi:heparan-alpha-glucosaminide N-acetyltransferase [uncultured Methylobacterium sp.]|uniref:heparan-alpha-glucosaminide N-acetyltransferase n=1 Tax=uncultured Methylobacterium sp. TaxID=157278 RepID=UPI0035CACDE9